MGLKQGDSKLTLSIDSKVLNRFKKHCSQEGLIISKQVEKFMNDKIKTLIKEGGD